jgi:hypothetical protein
MFQKKIEWHAVATEVQVPNNVVPQFIKQYFLISIVQIGG